ncbi:MAG TPA: cyclic pyranopterin monophosphate synthase MoaC, partial [Asanoa sp.]|nr:cyclic pyranopterin monophosphate synthase MoaC [Asanoa sp.]
AVTRTTDRTGVEMEALTAVATAGLALVDMVKAVDPAASINDVRVLRKEGGKTGLWTREGEQ